MSRSRSFVGSSSKSTLGCSINVSIAEPVKEFDDAPQLCIDPAADYTARFVTNQGDIVVDLATDTAPGTVNNFVTLARYGYYDGTPIFRADPSIDIIQGGGEDNTDDPGYTIPDEGSGFTYQPGDLAMANTGQPDSAQRAVVLRRRARTARTSTHSAAT